MRPAALLALSLVSAAPLPALAARSRPPVTHATAPATDVRLVRLGNGLRLLLAPDPDANAVEVAVSFPRRERPGLSGISRLFERLRSGSSSDPQEPERRIQAEGGSASSWTTPDQLYSEETVPAAGLDEALRLEGDRLGRLALDAGALERRKRELADERARTAASAPMLRALEALQRLAWTAHPYRLPANGLEADVARITVADCQAWHRDRLGPREALVVVAGAFDPSRALESAKRWLESVRTRGGGADAVPAEPPQKAERRATERMPLPAPWLVVGWRLPPHADPDGPAFALLSRILTSGSSSRLQAALTSDPLRCIAVQGAFDSRRDGGLLLAAAMPRPGVDTAAVERALFAEADRLAREPVSADELERARRQEEIATILPWQTVRGRAEALATGMVLDGSWDAAAARLDRLRALTPEDLRKAAARVFAPAARNVLWALPEADVPPGSATGASIPPGGDR